MYCFKKFKYRVTEQRQILRAKFYTETSVNNILNA
ncbi:hypothetical protein DYBT9623_01772 [Dyadobacter sp. CECT 9623]|uniref:Transposase n=1 Tax=Dyadobacter linearis TaxID=2823330 RepID=A0ABM8UNL5_9BACT|nr:hypothetical protein DYBT9623_01772 [Dyadobacter sp. CECT 9623]